MENACLQCTERCHQTHRVWSEQSMRACPLCISNCNLTFRVPFFFKYVTAGMESTYHEPTMEIPQHFAKKHIPDSVCHVEMEGPNNTLWYVKLHHEDDQCLLQQGWNQFAESTDITRGDALLFKLTPTTSAVRFTVKIFKRDSDGFVVQKTPPAQPLHHHHRADFQRSRCRRASHQQVVYRANDQFSTNPLVRNVKQKNTVEDAGMKSKVHLSLSKMKEKETHCPNHSSNDGAHGTTVRNEHCTEMVTAKDSKQMVVTGKETNACTDIVNHNKNESKSNIRTESRQKDKTVPCLINAAASISIMPDQNMDVVEEAKLHSDAIHHIPQIKNTDNNKKEALPAEANSCSTKHEPDSSCSLRTRKRNTTDRECEAKPTRKAAIIAMGKISDYMSGSPSMYHCHKQDSTSDNQSHKVPKLEKTTSILRCMDRVSGCNTKGIASDNYSQGEVTSLQKLATNAHQEDNFLEQSKAMPSISCQLPKMEQDIEKKTCQKKFPSFYKLMSASSVSAPYTLSIPKAFADQYMQIASSTFDLWLTLAGEQKSWSVNCRMAKSGVPTINTQGWRSFAVSNGIKMKDMCVFHMVDNFKFNVEIRRCSSNSNYDANVLHCSTRSQQLLLPTQKPSSSHVSVKIKGEKA